MTRVGVDLGGTKIEAVRLSGSGETLAKKRIATPREDYAATIEAIAALVDDVGPGDGVGVGIPGTISPATGLVKNANSTWLNGRPLKRDLEARLGREVRIANDANCFALSEARDGAAAGAASVFGVIVGTGCGAGLVVEGRVIGGANAIAGEWGHNPLPWPADGEWPGPPCWCGKTGCAELFLSGTGLARDGGAPAEELVRRDDPAVARWEDRFARALAAVINVFDPEVVVVGGGLSNIARLYQRVPPLLPRWVFSDRVDVKLVPPKHGDASGARGAAWLV